MIDSLAQAVNELVVALESLHIRFLIGGSLASSARGVLRATFDADLVAAISPTQTKAFSLALGKWWYADADMMDQAIRTGGSFNLIHMPTAQKIDIFPATTEFHRSQLGRADVVSLTLEGAVSCPVATAEDILLAKLRWYLDGGEVSTQQWRDILGLLKIASLDHPYLQHWAARLGVTDLLAKAQADAQLD